MRRPTWIVLAPGDVEEIAALVRGWFDAIDERPDFAIAPGSRRYHAVCSTRRGDFGREGPLADALAEASTEPVYAIALGDEPYVLAIRRGAETEVIERDPDELAESLDCSLASCAAQ